MKKTLILILVGAFRTVSKGMVKKRDELESRGRIKTIDGIIVKIGLNTLKSPGDLKRLAVT